MADVKGLLADPDFQKLDVNTQKSTLGKLDSQFSSLSDGDFLKFRADMQEKHAGSSRSGLTGRDPRDPANPKSPNYKTALQQTEGFLASPIVQTPLAVGGALGLAAGAPVGATVASAAKKLLPPLVTGATTGYLGKKAAQFAGASPAGSNVVGFLTGLAGGALESKIGSFVRSIPEEITSGSSFLKLAKWLATKNDPEAKVIAQKLIASPEGLYEEVYGKPPATHKELFEAKGLARRVVNEAAGSSAQKVVKPPPVRFKTPEAETAPVTKPAPPVRFKPQETPTKKPVVPAPPVRFKTSQLAGEEPAAAPEKPKGPLSKLTGNEGNETKAAAPVEGGFNYPAGHVADLRKQLFANHNKELVRSIANIKYGKSIKDMTKDELLDMVEFLSAKGI